MTVSDHQMNHAERQLVTFHLGEDEFGVDIRNVREIVRVPDIKRVPNAPEYIVGVCNLRGQVLPILDGRTRLGLAGKERDVNNRVLVIDADGAAIGVIVDRVSEVLSVSLSDIEEPPRIVRNVSADWLQGVVKLEGGERLIMLLDILRVVDADRTAALQLHEQAASGFAAAESKQADAGEDDQLVSFLLGQEEYAIGIGRVKEIIRVPEIMKVPNCEAYVEGVVSIRNYLLPIINLRTYFGMAYQEITDQTRIVVVDMGGFPAGIMVDKVLEVLRIRADVIQPLPKFSMQAGEQLTGVARLNGGKRLIILFEPKSMLSAEQYEAISSSRDDGPRFEEERSDGKQALDEEHLVTFRIDAEEFGIKIRDVQEINRLTEVTKIPRAPHYINGIVNLRGNVIPVLDLRKRFNLAEAEATDATRIIIVDHGGMKTGVVVDSVSEVLRFERSLIEPPPDLLSSGVDSDYVEGVGKLNDGRRMILILNLEKVIGFRQLTA